MKRIALAVACLLACSCGGGKKQFFVAFSQANNAEPYRAAQNALMTKLWAEHPDVRLEISDAQQDNSKQIGNIETFLRQKPDLLIVAPNERTAVTDVMRTALDRQIPVICLERDVSLPNYTTYIHSDNIEIGRAAGVFIAESLKKKYGEAKGNVVAIRGLLGVEGEINRDKGAKEVFAQYPGIKIVADPVADWLQDKAKDRMTETMRAQPRIDVVYGHNDPMAIGAWIAARDLGIQNDILFVGVDGLGGASGGIKKVMDGVLAATFIYPLCVDKAVEIGNRMLHDPSFRPEREYVIPSTMVTKENAAKLYAQQ
jgi:ribose transport system substrate-binding protein